MTEMMGVTEVTSGDPHGAPAQTVPNSRPKPKPKPKPKEMRHNLLMEHRITLEHPRLRLVHDLARNEYIPRRVRVARSRWHRVVDTGQSYQATPN